MEIYYNNPFKMDHPSTSGSHNNNGTTNLKSLRVSSCFVPKCPSNSISFPNKMFITGPGPSNPVLREKWFKAAMRDGHYSPKTVIRCCEDHFDLENDIENWIKLKLFGGRVYLKKGVVPHFFDCQNRMPKTSSDIIKQHETLRIIEDTNSETQNYSNTDATSSQSIKRSSDKSVHVAIYPYKRSKKVQAEVKILQNTVALSPMRVNLKHSQTSPIKQKMYELIYSSSDSVSERSFEYEVGAGSTSESISDEYHKPPRQTICDITMGRILAQPKLYLGIPLSCSVILQFLQKHIKCKFPHVCLVLKKLRLNESFTILADDFDLHESTVSRIFSRNCWKMAAILKKFIIHPSRSSVLANLPISFRNSYSKTYCLIDCLEIEMEAPSNTVHQAQTYSSYKKCNTMKYLVSATPDGIINFVSDGFGGRTSDLTIFEESKIIDVLPPGASIMADRGFKHIEGLLAKNQLQLIRPPSVSGKQTRQDVLKSKKIASLRIHIERVIRRLREYSFLKPHACVDHYLIPNLDHAMTICCALVNLQSSLIKTE